MKALTALSLAAILVASAGCSSNDVKTSTPAKASTTSVDGASTTSTSAPATTTTVVAQKGCGAAAAPAPGDSEVHIQSGGIDRWYLQHVPATAAPASGWPVIIDFHGFSEGAKIHTVGSALGPYGDSAGFVTIDPQGTGSPAFWNSSATPGVVDDVQFTRDLLAHVESGLCVDPARVFAAGLSNGAFMTSRVACDMSDVFAAVAPVAGIIAFDCTPKRPVPVIAFHGTADTFVPFNGGIGSGAASLKFTSDSAKAVGAKLLPVPQAAAAWAKRNGCTGGPTERSVAADVKESTWAGCPPGAEVELYVVDGGGHTWPGSKFFTRVANIVGRTTMSIDANALLWAFFQAHPLPSR